MSKFKVGDVVTLNSGGLPMTVVQLSATGTVAVHWFESKPSGMLGCRPSEKTMCMNAYPEAVLTLVAPAPDPAETPTVVENG